MNEDFFSLKVKRCKSTRGFLCWTFGAAVLFHLFMSQIGSALRGGVKGARPGCVHGPYIKFSGHTGELALFWLRVHAGSAHAQA